MHIPTHKHTHALARVCAHTHTHTQMYTHMHRDTHLHTQMHTHTHTYTNTKTHTYIYIHIHVTHAHTHRHPRTHTDTYTHTQNKPMLEVIIFTQLCLLNSALGPPVYYVGEFFNFLGNRKTLYGGCTMHHKSGHLNYHLHLTHRGGGGCQNWGGGQICYHDIRICMEKDCNPME